MVGVEKQLFDRRVDEDYRLSVVPPRTHQPQYASVTSVFKLCVAILACGHEVTLNRDIR